MTAVSTTSRPQLRSAPDSRPPCHRWPQPAPTLVDQPMLALQPGIDTAPGQPAAISRRAEVRVWGASPPDTVPDARAWGASLASALVQVLQGLRPLPQLTRWVDERVLATLALASRRTPARTAAPSPPAVVQSIRVQHPHAQAAEVAAHVGVGHRSVAIAFRLEVCGDRWLCTAAEFDLAPIRPSGRERAADVPRALPAA